jgi:hypothetical protein
MRSVCPPLFKLISISSRCLRANMVGAACWCSPENLDSLLSMLPQAQREGDNTRNLLWLAGGGVLCSALLLLLHTHTHTRTHTRNFFRPTLLFFFGIETGNSSDLYFAPLSPLSSYFTSLLPINNLLQAYVDNINKSYNIYIHAFLPTSLRLYILRDRETGAEQSSGLSAGLSTPLPPSLLARSLWPQRWTHCSGS